MTEETSEDERDIELSSIAAIFPELSFDVHDTHRVSLELSVAPSVPLQVAFKAQLIRSLPSHPPTPPLSDHETNPSATKTPVELEIHHLTHLPPLRLHVSLPDGYPVVSPPEISLSAELDWIPSSVLERLRGEVDALWQEYGHSQVLFAIIDWLQQAAEQGFGLNDLSMLLPHDLKIPLLSFDKQTKRKKFEAGTYNCGICLEPKKGSACHQLRYCGHVFCIACLQDFYNNAITEGDVTSVKCLDPDCGKTASNGERRRTRKQRTLHPSELLDIPLEPVQVQRYVTLKLKKKLESDKSTIYCPRSWCQAPARSQKYARYNTQRLEDFPESDSETDEPASDMPQTDQGKSSDASKLYTTDRLAICSKCTFAFCRTCQKSWHGDFVNCLPIDRTKLDVEEQASYDYIRLNTSPCPTCASPCQKTHGCNHMNCFQCNTHFCYLCSAWLPATDPYKHFNQIGQDCYMRLWELEEGDEDPEGAGARRPNVFAGARAAEAANYAAGNVPPPPLPAVQALPALPTIARENAAVANVADGNDPNQVGLDFVAEVLNELRIEAFGVGAFEAGPVRNHRPAAARRGPQARRGGANRAANQPAGPQEALQRFLQMAADDEEDGWDSDELEFEGFE